MLNFAKVIGSAKLTELQVNLVRLYYRIQLLSTSQFIDKYCMCNDQKQKSIFCRILGYFRFYSWSPRWTSLHIKGME